MSKQIVARLGLTRKLCWFLLGVVAVLAGLGWAGLRAVRAGGGAGQQGGRSLAARAVRLAVAPKAVAAAPLATLTVTSTGDGTANAANCPGANCRLRDAIAKAVAGDTIDFSFTGTITLTAGELVINKHLTIQGPGANLLTVRRDSSASAFRIFTVNASTVVNLSGLTITGGRTADGFENCIFGACTTGSGGDGGGIHNSGQLALTGVAVSSNSTGRGGGFGGNLGFGSNGGSGGGVFNTGTLTVTNSTFSSNSTGNGGGGSITSGSGGSGGGINNSGTLTVTNCTFSGNSTGSNGGTLGGPGGGINNSGTLTVTNSTFSSNSTGSGGGGGGIRNSNSASSANLRNTIVALNSASGSGPDLSGSFTSQGYNLIGKNDDAATSFPAGNPNANNDKVGTSGSPLNPLLGSLANNSGPTQTCALLPGSPAINAGDNCVVQTPGCLTTPLTTDQRGAGFNRQVGSAVDIGAFESRGFNLQISGGNSQTAMPTTAFSNPLVVTVSSAFGEPVQGGVIAFTPVPNNGASATLSGNPATLNASNQASVTATANAVTGSYSVTAGANGLTSVSFMLTNTCPSFAPSTPTPTGTPGTAYSSSVAATPSAPQGASYQYSLANSTSLPAGLSLNAMTGAITGTPTTPGNVNFTIKVEFFNGVTTTGCAVTQNFSINITCPSMTVGTPANGALGVVYNSSVAATPAATNGLSYQYSLANGTSLPAGLSLNTSTGDITGTPTASGPVNFTIKVELFNGATTTGCAVTQNFSINITCVTNLEVTNGYDSGAGSLRQALAVACPGSTITFANGISLITLISGELIIDKSLQIQGPGANLLTVQRDSAATTNYNIFTINGGQTVQISGLTISNGFSSGSGGGIRNLGTLTLTNSTVSGNSSNSNSGGGINNLGTLTLTNSTVSGNSSVGGGGIANSGTVTLMNSTVSGNSASGGGGGIYSFGGTLNVTNSTVSGNSAGFNGGGIVNNNTLNVTNSTISGNSAVNGGGIYAANTINVTLTGVTVTNNRADHNNDGSGTGGGIYIFGSTPLLRNTIVAGNFNEDGATDSADDIKGPNSANASSSYNLIGTGGSGGLQNNLNGNLVGVPNPQLLPLLDNGGTTQTHALLPGSPAINAGSNALALDQNNQPLTTDQRGTGFNRQVGGTVDIGAFELSTPPTINAAGATRTAGSPTANSNIATVNDIESGASGVTVTVNNGVSATVGGVTVSNIVNTGGAVTADIIAGCGATDASFTLTATDSDGATTTTTLNVTVTPNPAPTLGYANPPSVGFGGSLTVTPSSEPSDNGGISSIQLLSQGSYTGGIAVDNSTGKVTLTNAAPPGNHLIKIQATDNCGATKDASFTLTVNCPQINASLTGSQAICPGGSATLSVNLTGGTAPYTVKLSDGQEKTSSTLPITFTVSPSVTTTYNVLSAKDAYGCAATISSSATVTVNAAPTVTTDPASQTVCVGGSVTLTASASGSPAPTVQWQVSTNGGSSFSDIAGQTSTSLTLSSINATQHGYQYRARFSNTCGTNIATQAATLTVNTAPAVTTNPTSQTVLSNSQVTFTAAATGTPTPSVQWQVQANGASGFSNINGATSTTLSFAVSQAQSGNQYRAVFTNSCSTATTTAATLTVHTPPSVTTQPSGQTVCAGSTATFTVAASGTPTPTVQWQVCLSGGNTFSDIAGATSTTLSFATNAAQSGNKYRAVFTNAGGTATTSQATLTVIPSTAITTPPTAQSKLVGQSEVFSVTAVGTNLSYQWRKNGNPINGATASSYSIAAVVPGDAGNYDVVVNGACGSATSSAAALTVNAVRGDARFSGDYDGDGQADLIVWRAATATFWVYTSATGSTITKQLGVSTDVPVPGDYDGDGKTDFALWRPATGAWLIVLSSNGTTPNWQWGSATDVPVPGDYDGDGKTDLAVWRPGNGTWMIDKSTGGTMTTPWGMVGDVPLPGDYDGDGQTDLAVWRTSTATFWIYSPATNTTTSKQWGAATDVPVPGDYDGDDQTDIAVWQPSTGTWLICHSTNGATVTGQWGNATDAPVPGDYDGDGKTDYAIWRPANRTWMVFKSSGGTSIIQWGAPGDLPVR